jgi:hypothetical protein
MLELLKIKFRISEKYPDNMITDYKDAEIFDKALSKMQFD